MNHSLKELMLNVRVQDASIVTQADVADANRRGVQAHALEQKAFRGVPTSQDQESAVVDLHKSLVERVKQS